MSLKHFGGGQPDTTTQPHTHAHTMSHWHTHTHTCRKSLNHLGQDSVATLDFGQKHVNTEHKEGFICGGRSPLHQPVFTGLFQKVEQRAATMKSWVGGEVLTVDFVMFFSPVRKLLFCVRLCIRIEGSNFFLKLEAGQGISISAHFIINSLEC